MGPIWCPRVYGKDLTAFEIASSGKVAITLNDIHSLDFSRTTYIDASNYKNTILSQSNYSMALSANAGDLQMVFDAYSNNINISAASNVSVAANSGNMTFTTSNDTIISTSNNFNLEARSNINLNAATGSATISAQNSNTYLTMEQQVLTAYASNAMFISACNNLNINTNSNINIGTLGGDLKAYADSSNMYLTMEKATDNVTLYTLSNMYLSASNNYNLNAQSNINIGALGGDIQLYSQSSNMFLTMQAATNNVGLFASNNMNISVSNNQNTAVKSNISTSTVGGDYRLYVNSSNMFMRMSATTNNINIFSSNSTIISASNNFNLYALSNLTASTSNGSIELSANSSNMFLTMDSAVNDVSVFSSNNVNIGASNNYNLSVKSNINQGAEFGDFKAYADASNMYLTMERATDTITMYASSNVVINSSNNYSLNAKSNINIGALGGDVKIYSQQSNMSIIMHSDCNNMAFFASNDLSMQVKNSMYALVDSNISFSAMSGDVKTYADASNMYLTMEKATDDVKLFTLSNMYLTASNSLSITTASNMLIGALGGDFKAYADSSNMYLTMEDATDTVKLYTLSNMFVSASNSYNLNAKNDILMGALVGDVKIYSDKSNMFLTMDHLTDTQTMYTSNQMNLTASNSFALNAKSNIVMNAIVNKITMFASNNVEVTTSNTYTLNARSNVLISALNGDFNAYADSSNMSLTMARATDTVTLYTSSNLVLSASNDLNIFVNSNITASANNGDVLLYANSSNMSLTMDHLTNNTSVYTSNNMLMTASNSFTVSTYSNVSLSADLGSVQVYSASSNMSLVMDAATLNTSMYTSNNMKVSVSNNYNVNVNNSMNVEVTDLTIIAHSNMSLAMISESDTIIIQSTNAIFLNASDLVLINTNDIETRAMNDAKTYADGSNMYLTMEKATDDVNLFTLSNMYLTASNSLSITTASNMLIGALGGDFKAYADASNMYLTMEDATDTVTLYTTSNMFVSASNSYNLNAKNDILMGALDGDVKIYSDKSNMFLTMDHLTDTQTMYTSNQMNLTASNSFALNAKSNIVMNAIVNKITMFASNNVEVTTSNTYTLNARSNVLIGALNGDFKAYANSSNMVLTMDHLTNDTTLFASNDVNIGASNNLSVNAKNNMVVNANNGELLVYANSNLKFNADQSNMYINFNMPSDVIDIYSLSNVSVAASNNMFLEASSNISVNASNISILSHADLFMVASNNMTIAASNAANLKFGSLNVVTTSDQGFTAESNVKFFITSASNTPSDPIFTISGNQVFVRGDMVITGDITTSNVFSTTVIQESLKVSDKQIRLANTGSNFNPADGPFDSEVVNSGAGIAVDGVPSYFDATIVAAYDKSLNWNYGSGTGIDQLGSAAGMSNEPYWEMKGGSFQLTHQKIIPSGGSNIVQDISFRWRVNELDELEMVKTFWYAASNAYVTRRIARFGRIL